MKKLLALAMLMAAFTKVSAQNFEEFFTDNTLRIDYTFSGNAKEQYISIDKLNKIPYWYGKKKHLSETPVEGNGQITVKDHKTGEVIYKNSFSTLFQEWLTYDEAKKTSKSFENVFLVPMPKKPVDVTVDLRNNRREVASTFTHTVNPEDILIRHIGEKEVTPFKVLQMPEDKAHCIHISYVAEGYTKEDMPTFIEDAKIAMEALFEHEPFKKYRDRFYITAVMSESEESGTSEPSKGIWKKTALHSHFDTFYSNRYLTTLNLKDLHDVLAGIPYEHIIVLVNTEEYGGGGILNSYNLSMTHNKYYKQVVVHEFGHSFGGLADEYAYDFEQLPFYPADVEPWEPNITTLADFHGKWEDMIKEGTPVPTPESKDAETINSRVGLFEGAGYSLKGVYRGVQDCRMRTNSTPYFCPVCRNSLEKTIKFYTE